ncbi:MAG: hypothetical protein RL077_5613, partial [Verrucomicrobiota bacterium]
MKSARTLLAVLAVSATVGSVASGQSIAPPPPTVTSAQTGASARPEEAIELSPFVISATAETGWIATETLAGSR